MRIIVAAIGRMKKGPEQDLIARYGDRIKKSGKSIGITALDMIEIPESRASESDIRKREEADVLIGRLPEGCPIFVFDERGKRPSSRDFAATLSKTLDSGAQSCAFLIGGPDGFAEALRDRAQMVVSFGSLTVPHQIVRILVLEQIYRATTILTNHPYHRD